MAPRIAIVIDSWDYPYNGTVVSTRRFVAALNDKFDIKLLATQDPDKPEDERIVPFKKLSLPGFNHIINSMKVPLARWNKRLLDKTLSEVDLLHVQFPFFLGYRAVSIAKRKGVPVVASFHVQPENLLHNLGLQSERLAELLYKLFIWAFYNRADLVIAPSQFAAELLLKHGLHRPIEVLSNGVPEEFYQVDRGAREAGSSFRILTVGRFAPEKQQEVILRAVALSQHHRKIELVMAGAGPLESDIRGLAHDLDIRASIGFVSDEKLLALYGQADLFIHAGEIELEGMSVMEAMAAGNTVLISDSAQSATSELIDYEQGKFKSGDIGDLSRKIDYWYSQNERREEQGHRNQVWAEQRSHSRSVDNLTSIYMRLICPEHNP